MCFGGDRSAGVQNRRSIISFHKELLVLDENGAFEALLVGMIRERFWAATAVTSSTTQKDGYEHIGRSDVEAEEYVKNWPSESRASPGNPATETPSRQKP